MLHGCQDYDYCPGENDNLPFEVSGIHSNSDGLIANYSILATFSTIDPGTEIIPTFEYIIGSTKLDPFIFSF